MPDQTVDPRIQPIEYNGMNVGFCCNKCRRKFSINPKKYLSNLEKVISEAHPGEAAVKASDRKSTASAAESAPPHSNVSHDPQTALSAMAAAPQTAKTDPPDPTSTVMQKETASTAPAAAAQSSQSDDDDGDVTPTTTFGKFIAFIGRIHPVMVHFPIALLLAAALAEFIGLFVATPFWRNTGWYCAVLGAIGAIVAAGMGWLDAMFMGHPGMENIVTLHRWFGTSTAVIALVAVIYHAIGKSRNRPKFRTVYLVLLFLAAALVGVTGFFGGMLIYGAHYFFP